MLRAGKARSRLSLAIERKALAKATRTAVLTGQTPHAAQETTFFFHGLTKVDSSTLAPARGEPLRSAKTRLMHLRAASRNGFEHAKYGRGECVARRCRRKKKHTIFYGLLSSRATRSSSPTLAVPRRPPEDAATRT